MYHYQYYLLFYYYIITTYEIKGRTRERSPPSFESSSPFVLSPFLRMVALPVCDRTAILLVSFFVRLLRCGKVFFAVLDRLLMWCICIYNHIKVLYPAVLLCNIS